jgi:prepilin-type N-terminal cleavage/methylation domain-containing protein
MLSRPDGPATIHATPGRRRPRAGFTLAEMLIVIGIIAVLAGLLLTVRSRASDQARSAQCMNNLRQIGMAMTLYAQGNNQAFPFSSHFNTPADPPLPAGEDRKSDWVHFRAAENDLQKKVNASAIASYAKVKGPALIDMMRCPADDVETHQTNPTAKFPYRFSYAMNLYMASDDMGKGLNRGATPRVTAISRPGEKILVVEENSGTINDGAWELPDRQQPPVQVELQPGLPVDPARRPQAGQPPAHRFGRQLPSRPLQAGQRALRGRPRRVRQPSLRPQRPAPARDRRGHRRSAGEISGSCR